MDREWAMIRIGGADVPHHFGPLLDLLPIVVAKTLGEIPGKICLAGGTPDDGQRSVSRHQVPPMLFGFVDAHPGHEVTPSADDAGREALVDKIFEPFVCGVEIL